MDVTILGEDPDELEVYGADTRSGPSLTSYRFEVALLALPLHCCKNYMYVCAPVQSMLMCVCLSGGAGV